LKQYVGYKPPGPPEGTGEHRYVFVVMIASNGTTEALDLETPSDRKHWGYEGDRSGVREFAKKHGLKVIGEFLLLFLFIVFLFLKKDGIRLGRIALLTLLQLQTSSTPRMTSNSYAW
jgi:hypothetical protein